MRQNILIAIFTLFSMLCISYALTPTLTTSYQSVFDNWLPIILAGIMVAISLTVVYYFIGVFLNSTRIKGAAQNEIQQIIGTSIIILLVVGLMAMIGSGVSLSYQSALSQGPNPVTNQVSNICNNILVNAQVGFLDSNGNSANYPQPYNRNLPQPTSAVCQIVNGNSGVDPLTSHIDYGLAATYVIIANVTNQSIDELNYLYNYDSMLFFLRSVTAYSEFCEPVACVVPLDDRAAETVIYYNIYRGYVFQRTIMPVMDTQSNLAIYLNMSQLVIIVILLITWPYLLVIGVLLRILSMTRRAGGLLIAIVLVGMVIYPTIYLFQYAALNNLNPPGQAGSATGANLIGPNAIPALSLCGVNLNTPTLSGFTNSYTGAAGAATTQFQLFCYTSSNELTVNDIYRGVAVDTAPTVLDSANPGQLDPIPASTRISDMENNCANQGLTVNPDMMCACPSGTSGFYTGVGQWDNLATCYVQKNLNFYVFPNAASVIRLYTCYPPDYANSAHTAQAGTGPDGILYLEVTLTKNLDSQFALNVITSMTSLLSSTVGATLGTQEGPLLNDYGMPCSVSPLSTFDALTSLINLYGYMSVVTFMIPLLNILVLLSTTLGISGMMGGETNIIGLSRFI